MKLERIGEYLKFNLLEHNAGIVLTQPLEDEYDLGEVLEFPRTKWEEYFSPRKCDRICRVLREIRMESELESILASKITLLPIEDPDYPALLREIYNPPRLLYVLGKLPTREMIHVAVVGSRDATMAGKCAAEEVGRFLAEPGISVVSGLARGVDRAAHRGVIASNPRGYALAVVASGVGEYLKPRIWSFYEQILLNGSIISEFPLSFPATKRNFPLRNRIITGISSGTVLVEGKIRSGSMISARLAIEQGRELFAVPGPMHSELSAGPHQMIRSGASLLSSPKDILEDLKLEPRKLQRIEVSDEENFLLDKISEGPTDMEEILYNSQLPLTKVLGLIRALENKDLVKRIAGNKVLRLPKPSRSRDS